MVLISSICQDFCGKCLQGFIKFMILIQDIMLLTWGLIYKHCKTSNLSLKVFGFIVKGCPKISINTFIYVYYF